MKIKPNAPLFRDPVYDGAADPVVIWNRKEKEWWLFYTNRRAWSPNNGFSYIHGTKIGIASSGDHGKTWIYRGTAKGLEFEPGTNTFWAPEIMENDGIYHMYVSYVRGIPTDWNCGRKIIHYTSTDMFNWKYESVLPLASERAIDACVLRLPDGRFKMWYKDEEHDSYTYTAYSEDLYHWNSGDAEITDCAHEGPNVFVFRGKYWMITDPWEGLGVYVSSDAKTWKRCPNILQTPGTRRDDGVSGAHADVLVAGEHAYIFYFTHPEKDCRELEGKEDILSQYRRNRSSIQVAELFEEDGQLICERNQVEIDLESAEY